MRSGGQLRVRPCGHAWAQIGHNSRRHATSPPGRRGRSQTPPLDRPIRRNPRSTADSGAYLGLDDEHPQRGSNPCLHLERSQTGPHETPWSPCHPDHKATHPHQVPLNRPIPPSRWDGEPDVLGCVATCSASARYGSRLSPPSACTAGAGGYQAPCAPNHRESARAISPPASPSRASMTSRSCRAPSTLCSTGSGGRRQGGIRGEAAPVYRRRVTRASHPRLRRARLLRAHEDGRTVDARPSRPCRQPHRRPCSGRQGDRGLGRLDCGQLPALHLAAAQPVRAPPERGANNLVDDHDVRRAPRRPPPGVHADCQAR